MQPARAAGEEQQGPSQGRRPPHTQAVLWQAQGHRHTLQFYAIWLAHAEDRSLHPMLWGHLGLGGARRVPSISKLQGSGLQLGTETGQQVQLKPHWTPSPEPEGLVDISGVQEPVSTQDWREHSCLALLLKSRRAKW